MAAPYLVEIRTGGEVKHRLREIIYDVADRFDVRGAAEPRAVPHVTLYGPYNTNQGAAVKDTLTSIYSIYDVVPFRVEGFDTFPENNVIYAKVVPSRQLRGLRRDISRELSELTYNTRPWDSDFFYDFHITIAFKDVGSKFDDIWNYVTNRYDPSFEEYAIRCTSLRGRNMLWEYDLLQDAFLDPDAATSAATWQRSKELLAEQESETDHSNLDSTPGVIKQYGRWARAKFTGRW